METQLPEYFSLEEHYGVYRPHGTFTITQAIAAIDGALEFCCGSGIRALLADITRMEGFPPPSTTERFIFATKWAATAAGRVILSVVSLPEWIDPDRIGVMMAGNRGLQCNVFTEESDAIAWLVPDRQK